VSAVPASFLDLREWFSLKKATALRDLDGLISTEAFLDDLVAFFQFSVSEDLFSTIGKRPPGLIDLCSGSGVEHDSPKVERFSLREPMVVFQ